MAKPDIHPRRHVFHGHASGVSAHIRRPEKQLLPVQGSSSLPVTGGRSESNVPAGNLDKWVSFDSITTSAHGDYVDAVETGTDGRSSASIKAINACARPRHNASALK